VAGRDGAAGVTGGRAIQRRKDIGAEVTGPCRAQNVDDVRALGADAAIAYDATDSSQVVSDQDAVVDPIGGNLRSLLAGRAGVNEREEQ